jgi:hypothetical protein
MYMYEGFLILKTTNRNEYFIVAPNPLDITRYEIPGFFKSLNDVYKAIDNYLYNKKVQSVINGD